MQVYITNEDDLTEKQVELLSKLKFNNNLILDGKPKYKKNCYKTQEKYKQHKEINNI